VATPIHVQPRGVRGAAICLDEVQKFDDCAPHHVARAGISALPWKGGNMPDSKAFEQKLYHWEDTQSGFTVLTFAIVSGLLVFAGAMALAGELAGGATSIASSGGAAVFGSSLGDSALAGVMSAGGYLGVTDVMHPGSILDQQHQFLGSTTGTGELQPIKPQSEHSAALLQAARALQIANPLKKDLSGVQEMYQGNCDESWTVEQCLKKRLRPGHSHRPDSYIELNGVLTSKQNGPPVKDGALIPVR
jgi:hypothetical protein